MGWVRKGRKGVKHIDVECVCVREGDIDMERERGGGHRHGERVIWCLISESESVPHAKRNHKGNPAPGDNALIMEKTEERKECKYGQCEPR